MDAKHRKEELEMRQSMAAWAAFDGDRCLVEKPKIETLAKIDEERAKREAKERQEAIEKQRQAKERNRQNKMKAIS